MREPSPNPVKVYLLPNCFAKSIRNDHLHHTTLNSEMNQANLEHTGDNEKDNECPSHHTVGPNRMLASYTQE